MSNNHGVFQKIYLQENLILSYYPRPADSIGHYLRPADSIGHYVGLFVCLSVQNFSTFQISQLWDLIETWGFREDLPLVFPHDPR